MAKKFAEHNGLNLTQVNSDILIYGTRMMYSTNP